MICCLTCFLELRILNEMTIIQIKQIAEQNTRKCSFNWQLFDAGDGAPKCSNIVIRLFFDISQSGGI